MQEHSERLPKHLRRILASERSRSTEPEELKMDQYINDQGEKVTARQLDADNVSVISAWCNGIPVVEHDALDHDVTFPGINVPTSDGEVKRASQGHFVVRFPDGSFETLKPHEFRSKFREV